MKNDITLPRYLEMDKFGFLEGTILRYDTDMRNYYVHLPSVAHPFADPDMEYITFSAAFVLERYSNFLQIPEEMAEALDDEQQWYIDMDEVDRYRNKDKK